MSDLLVVTTSSDPQAVADAVAAGEQGEETRSEPQFVAEELVPGVSRESNSGSPPREAQVASYESPVSSRQRMLDSAEAELAALEAQPEGQDEQEPAEAPQYPEQQPVPAQVKIEELRAEILPSFVQRLNAATEDLTEEQHRASAAIPLSSDPGTAARLLDSFALLPGGIEAASFVMRNPAEKQKIASLPEHMAQVRIAQLANRFDPALQRRPSQAPKPIRPIGGSATTAAVDLANADYQTFKREREKQIKARRRQ
jgi:hypothetical protein